MISIEETPKVYHAMKLSSSHKVNEEIKVEAHQNVSSTSVLLDSKFSVASATITLLLGDLRNTLLTLVTRDYILFKIFWLYIENKYSISGAKYSRIKEALNKMYGEDCF